MKKILTYERNGISVEYDLESKDFVGNHEDIDKSDIIKYLKGVFEKRERFTHHFLDVLLENAKNLGGELDYDDLLGIFDTASPFSYKEAFEIDNTMFQAEVFGSIDIQEMMHELGAERRATEGRHLKNKIFSENGEFMGHEDYDVIYEVHEVDGEKLGLSDKLYTLKCWCTSTNEETWIWTTEEFKDDPLGGIANTCRAPENIIPYIKEIKRQGDLYFFELTEDVEVKGEPTPIGKEKYFELLTCQT